MMVYPPSYHGMPDIESKNPSLGNFLEKLPRTFFRVHQRNLGRVSCEGKKKKERNTRADIYRNPSLLTFEWSSNRVLGQRTRVSSTPRNSFIEKGVSSPWLTCRTRKEEERMRGRERERGGVQAGYRKLLLFYQPTVSTGETRSNGIKKPLRDRDCSRLTVSHPSPYPRSSHHHHHPLDSDQSDRSTATAMMTLLSFPATPLTRSDFLSAWKRRVSSGKTML